MTNEELAAAFAEAVLARHKHELERVEAACRTVLGVADGESINTDLARRAIKRRRLEIVRNDASVPGERTIEIRERDRVVWRGWWSQMQWSERWVFDEETP